MTSSTKRQAQADARREQLLEAALELFADRGVRGASIRDIARAAGVTEGLIYHYFENKHGLIRAVIERYNFAGEMTALITGLRDQPMREAVYRIARRFFELLSSNRKYVRMVTTQAQRDPEVAHIFGQVILRAFQAGRQFIERGIACGELRPHDPIVSLRFLHGSVLWFFLTHETLSPPLPTVSPDRFIKGIADILVDGIAAWSPRKEKVHAKIRTVRVAGRGALGHSRR